MTPTETERRIKWDFRYLRLCRFIAQEWSKDPSTKVGAVLVDSDYRLVSAGVNGFPRMVADTDQRLQDRETRLALTKHAEENALHFSGLKSAEDHTLYVWPLSPCTKCAGTIIQYNVLRVVSMIGNTEAHERWVNSTTVARSLMQEAGIIQDFYDKLSDSGE